MDKQIRLLARENNQEDLQKNLCRIGDHQWTDSSLAIQSKCKQFWFRLRGCSSCLITDWYMEPYLVGEQPLGPKIFPSNPFISH